MHVRLIQDGQRQTQSKQSCVLCHVMFLTVCVVVTSWGAHALHIVT